MKMCEEYAALLDMYVDGFCTAEETVRVRAHLAECEACRMYVEQILQMKEAFPDAESEEVPDELDAAVRLHVKRVYEKYDRNLTKTAKALKAARNTVKKYLEE